MTLKHKSIGVNLTKNLYVKKHSNLFNQTRCFHQKKGYKEVFFLNYLYLTYVREEGTSAQL